MSPSRILLALLVAAALLPASAAAAPHAAIFYYPWYGNEARDGSYFHWGQNGREPPLQLASNFFPSRGLYSSADPDVLRAQMRDIAAAGVRQVVSSWWGWGSLEDRRLPAVVEAARARGLDVAVHLEPYTGRTIASTAADIEHLRTLGITDFYVYRPHDFSPTAWALLNGTLFGVRMFAQTGLVGFAASGGFDGVYTYDVLLYGGASFGRLCEQARRARLLCAPSVGPGYMAVRATGDRRVKPRRLGSTYDGMWAAALAARADAVTITSYNEWGEGTQIEAADSTPGGGRYLTYDGAYGRSGAASEHAYLWRTRYWTRELVRTAPGA